jgi:hypothetical protein
MSTRKYNGLHRWQSNFLSHLGIRTNAFFFINNGFDVFFLQGMKLSVSEALGTNFVDEKKKY